VGCVISNWSKIPPCSVTFLLLPDDPLTPEVSRARNRNISDTAHETRTNTNIYTIKKKIRISRLNSAVVIFPDYGCISDVSELLNILLLHLVSADLWTCKARIGKGHWSATLPCRLDSLFVMTPILTL